MLDGHHEDCEKFPVQCVCNCDAMIPRGEMDEHVSRQGSCPSSQLDCDFKEVGCQFRGKRDDLHDHLETRTSYHLFLVVVDSKDQQKETKRELKTTKLEQTKCELQQTKCELAKTNDEFEKTKRELADVKGQLNMTSSHTMPQGLIVWKIEKWSKRVEAAKKGNCKVIYSQPFYVDPGYHFTFSTYPNALQEAHAGHLGVYLKPVEGTFDSMIN